MKKRTKNKDNQFKAFQTLFAIGVITAFLKFIDYIKWTFNLIRNWELPEAPFFSNVNLSTSNVDFSITAYLIFAIANIIVFLIIFYGFYQIHRISKLFERKDIFKKEVGLAFSKAGKSFFLFGLGKVCIEIAIIVWAGKTSIRISELFSTELTIFILFGYVMFFLADVFKEGIVLKEENELTI